MESLLLKIISKYFRNGWVCLLFSDEGKSKCFSRKLRRIEMPHFQWKETKIVLNLNDTRPMYSDLMLYDAVITD